MAALFARRERDGLSLRELSEATGIPLGTVSWWSWRLRQGSVPRPATEQFVELEVAPAVVGDVVVRFADVEIAAASGTDTVWLANLVKALRSC